MEQHHGSNYSKIKVATKRGSKTRFVSSNPTPFLALCIGERLLVRLLFRTWTAALQADNNIVVVRRICVTSALLMLQQFFPLGNEWPQSLANWKKIRTSKHTAWFLVSPLRHSICSDIFTCIIFVAHVFSREGVSGVRVASRSRTVTGFTFLFAASHDRLFAA